MLSLNPPERSPSLVLDTLWAMRTVVLGQPPPELEQMIARRRALGLDGHDEVWEGDYHMAPAPSLNHGLIEHRIAVLIEPLARAVGLVGSGPFNLGGQDNFRVPDHGWHRGSPSGTWIETAAIVLEVESPDDETWNKLDFYAAQGVDELIIARPENASIVWLCLEDGRYVSVDRSRLVAIGPAEMAAAIDWPPAD